MRKVLTADQKSLIRELYSEGKLTQREIAKQADCSQGSVQRIAVPGARDRMKAATREWTANNREHQKDLCRAWREENPDYAHQWYETNKDYRSAQIREWQENNRERRLFYAIRARAKELNVPFDPAISDALGDPPGNCPVCGKKMERHKGILQPNSPSVDRNIPELGYVPGNVSWMCVSCNSVKGKL